MKILQLNFERSWRGGERQTLLCMREFRAAGHEVELLARTGYPLAQRAREAGLRVHTLKHPSAMAAFLARYGHRYDIIHAQTAGALTWAVATKCLYRRPLVYSRRTATPVQRRARMTAFKWRSANRLVAISEAAAEEPRRLGLAPIVVPSAVEFDGQTDPARVAAFIAEHALAGKRILVSVAALTREKDPATLIRTLAALARRRQDFVLVHMGADGPLRADVAQHVQALGVAPYYRYVGFQNQPEMLFPMAEVFVCTSALEGLGSSVLDAFLRGVPVVSTDAGGLKEILADGRGILCPVGDAQALAAGIDRMLDDQALRHDAAARARAYAQHEHGAHEMGRRYLALYQEVLQQLQQLQQGQG